MKGQGSYCILVKNEENNRVLRNSENGVHYVFET